jgi:soluble lytic murein transglycosylase-like protein
VLAALLPFIIIAAWMPPVQAQSMIGSITNAADPYAAAIGDASRRFAIPENWIHAVMRAESSNEPSAVSSKGAIGLMQVMPVTYDELRLRHGLGSNPFEPHDNIIAGTAYLREMLDRFGGDGFLAAYNAGPQRYEEYLATGRALPEETVNYVAGLVAIVTEARNHDAITTLIGSTFAALAAPSMASLGGSPLAAELAMPMPRIVDLTALQPTSSAQWDADIYAAPIFIQRASAPEEMP